MFNYERVKDPEFFQQNRMAAHSDHIAYRNEEEAVIEKKSSFRESLNGLWKFHYAPNYPSAIPGFEKEDYCAKSWNDIYVPAHIQMEGYDAPQYANTQYPWDGHAGIKPGEIPEKFNPVASYVKYFQVPERMKGERLYISFQGVESCFALWLNGEYIGYSSDTFTPSEFELTGYIKEGDNKLAVQVFKWGAGSWLEDQDFFRFSGIFRDVYLYTVAEHHVWDVKVETELKENYHLGNAALYLKSSEGGIIQTELFDSEGRLVKGSRVAASEETKVCFEVTEPQLWSAENPALYTAKVKVLDSEDAIEEHFEVKIGFRHFEMDGNIMKLNGQRIVFKGVNRHEFNCDTGRVTQMEHLTQDLYTMKQNNINAIRTSHYPNDSRLYALADELGFYLIDECNMESHGAWDLVDRKLWPIEAAIPGDHQEYLEMLLDRVHSMYERDKNHPCILIWSCGNESFGGSVIHEMSQEFKKLDPSRLVHYEGIFHDRRYNDTSDMESQMYPSVASIEAFLAEHRDKPFICCEYTHAMGNSCGAMHKYTDLTDREPLYQGGFIWDYVDQSIRKKDRYGKEFQAYGGDHYERPTDYNFSGNGIVDGERRISPKMQEVKFNYQNISVEVEAEQFTVINKNLFSSTDHYDCVVILERNGEKLKEAIVSTCVAPLSRETYQIPFEEVFYPGEYVITVSFRLKKAEVWAPLGHEVAFGQGCYTVEAKDAEAEAKEETEGRIVTASDVLFGETCHLENGLEVVLGTYNIGVQGEHFEVLFSRLNGGLVSYKYADREMIEAIPKPNFWRAPVDNDCGNMMPFRYAKWKIASMYADHRDPSDPAKNFCLENPKVEIFRNMVKVTYTYYLPTTPIASCELSYLVQEGGRIETTLTYDPIEELQDMPEFSVMFKLNADYQKMQWYGMGPDDCYADRSCGGKIGVYQKNVQDNVAHYLVPQESGNHTEVRWMKLLDHKGRGMLFECNGADVCVSPYTPHELENAAHPYELPPVHYTVVRVGSQMGIGGDDSWGSRTHEEYLLDVSRKMQLTFTFKGI